MTAVFRGSGKPTEEVLVLSHNVVSLIRLLELPVPREAKKLDQDHTATKWCWYNVEVTANAFELVLSPWCWRSDEKPGSIMWMGRGHKGFPEILKSLPL